MAQKDFITGVFQRIRIQNLQNGYTVFDIRKSDGTLVTCSGCIIPPKSQIMLGVVGEWSNTPYGRQLSKCSIREIYTTEESFRDYLLHIKGIGPKLAEVVSQRVGQNFKQVMDSTEPEPLLAEIAGISIKKAELIVGYVQEQRAKTQLFSMLSKRGAPYAAVDKLFQAFGTRCLERLVASPFTTGAKAGLPFSVSDSIAYDMNLDMESNERICAAAEVVMNRQTSAGDVCLPVSDVAYKVRALLNNSAGGGNVSLITIANAILSDDRHFAIDGKLVYTRALYWSENRTAFAIRRIIKSGIHIDCDPDELCSYAESVCHVQYAEQQREIFKMLRHGGLGILTGGPGTGKTTVVKGFLTAFERLFPDKVIRLCAPTGRASQRMKEATGREACTVHRLIEYRPFGDSAICKNENDPIDADCIVLDEASMLSIDVAELFFSAVRPGTLVLLVGDTDQLPSVGPGNVLGDIIRSKTVPVVALTKTHRQGAGSPIIENAKRIREGDFDLLKAPDFEIIQCDDSNMPAAIKQFYMKYHQDDDPFAVQVLMPARRKRHIGSKDISAMLQKEIGHSKSGSVRYGDTLFCIGDKIMMQRNNYNVGYFNGDIGIIKKTTHEGVYVDVNGEELMIPNGCLEDMSLAYASTIHKSQGSEYNTVIVGLPSEPLSMLQRNILYTAITRGKKRVIVIAAQNCIQHCVTTVTTAKRTTRLCERLRNNKY